jgi:hypothetical protein
MPPDKTPTAIKVMTRAIITSINVKPRLSPFPLAASCMIRLPRSAAMAVGACLMVPLPAESLVPPRKFAVSGLPRYLVPNQYGHQQHFVSNMYDGT